MENMAEIQLEDHKKIITYVGLSAAHLPEVAEKKSDNKALQFPHRVFLSLIPRKRNKKLLNSMKKQ